MPLITSRTWIVLGGITLPTPAHHTDHLDEWLDGYERRGEDVQVPFVDGEHPTTHYIAARTITTRVVIHGDRDVDGNVLADPEVGLVTNLDALHTAWVGDAKGLVTAELHRADGKVFTGQVRADLNVQPNRFGTAAKAVVRCRLPAGVLTLVPPPP